MDSRMSSEATTRILRTRHREEALALYGLRAASLLVLAAPLALIVYLGSEALRLFTVDHVSPLTFLFSPVFDPDGGHPGAAAFIVGSLAVTLLAVTIASFFGFGMSFFLAELSTRRVASIMRSAVELLAGIPSVVFGWLGLTILVPFIRHVTGTAGFGLLSAALVLSLMILPTLVSLAVDVLRSVPRALRENSYALGATTWETLSRVVIPAASNGLIVALILATARAIGETLAVEMVIGNAGVIPHDFFHAAATLPTEIVIDMGGAPPGSLLEHALFAAAFVLMLISTLLISIVRLVMRNEVRK
jgi:phosphate transport system permease protein